MRYAAAALAALLAGWMVVEAAHLIGTVAEHFAAIGGAL